ncbi:MAG: hypothetical protein RBR08_12085 [Desulforegulaceae bacterium]|nr:hypothetical protein [Desulforegulaceae bacterium]
MFQKKTVFLTFFLVGFFSILLLVPEAMAFTPAGGKKIGEEIYQFAVTDLIGGPIGAIFGVICIILLAAGALKNNVPLAIGGLLAGIAVLKSATIATAMGMLF